MTTLSVAVLGLTSGFAMTVWAALTVTHLRARKWIMAFGYFNMAAVNFVSTGLLVFRLAGRPLDLPSGASTLILLPLIGIPPALSLYQWRKSTEIIQQAHNE